VPKHLLIPPTIQPKKLLKDLQKELKNFLVCWEFCCFCLLQFLPHDAMCECGTSHRLVCSTMQKWISTEFNV